MKKNNGFTLIELLVVVAIIAVLVSIIIAALGLSKSKGSDAAIKKSLSTVRAQAEIFYLNNDNSYLPIGGTAISGAPLCPVYSASGTNMFSKDQVMARAVAYATTQGGGTNSCYNTRTAWAIAITLRTDSTKSWCIDSSGKSKQVNSSALTAINSSTGICN